MAQITQTIGNTLIKNIPADYVLGSTAHWFVIPKGHDKGKKLFFYDVTLGQKETACEALHQRTEQERTEQEIHKADKTIVFVHGNPESSYTYRKIVREIEQDAKTTVRIVAMDHIGFGLSDQADFEMVDMHHAANLAQLIQHLDLQHVTLVIHDWGGAIGVGAFIDMAERVDNLVLMNTTIFPMPLSGMTYKNFPFPAPFGWNYIGRMCPAWLWKHVPPIVMHSKVGSFNLFKQALDYGYRAITNSLTDNEKLYQAMFSSAANAKSSMRNVKQTHVWGHGYRYKDDKHGMQDNHPFYQNMQLLITKKWGVEGRNIGVRAYFGQWDPIAQTEVQQQWLSALPQLTGHIQTFDDAGHFVEEWKYVEIAAGIMEVAKLR